MKPKDQFQGTISGLIEARAAVVTALKNGRAEKRARENAVQGLYLIAVRSFEAFLEDQIHGLATKKVKWSSRILDGGRVRCTNRLMELRPEFVKLLMLGGKEYVDYLPYDRTEKISQLLFTGGRPFTLLGRPEKTTLRRCQRVRNYIAHRSDFARAKFLSEYQNIKPLRVAKPTPSHYLDDQIRAGVTLFEHDLAELAAISNFLG